MSRQGQQHGYEADSVHSQWFSDEGLQIDDPAIYYGQVIFLYFL
jgi:hypothetical protein